MPRRTNEFQRLIAIIQAHMDLGANVAEPGVLHDHHTGTSREVDVVVSGHAAGHAVTIAIECRDRGRVSDVTWVEEMHGKHSRLPTNILVLASHSAFTPEAMRVADLYDIRCMVLRDVDSAAPERLFPNTQSLWGKVCQITIDRVSISVEASGGMPAECILAYPDTLLLFDDGTEFGTASQLANTLARSDSIKQKILRDAIPEHKFVEFGWERPVFQELHLCLQKMEPRMLRPIDRFHVVAKCGVNVEEFPLRHGRYGVVRVAWGKGNLLGQPTMLVATNASPKSPLITTTFCDSK